MERDYEEYEEGNIKGSLKTMTIKDTEKILDQMKNCVCKVHGNMNGTGFFCKITYQNKIVPVMITNYHIINDNFLKNNKQIKISMNNKTIMINIDKNTKIYSSTEEKYDMMIIKLKDSEININNFLEIDDNLFIEHSENSYKDESIYILHYPDNGKVSVSYGYGIEAINDCEYKLKHKCNTERGSSGGPILNLETNKIIGFHRAFVKRKIDQKNTDIKINQSESQFEFYNIGTFLKFPLNELNLCNEIKLKVKIDKNDVNKNVYFLDNTKEFEDKKGNKHIHDNLKELNSSNTELYINNEKTEYKKYFQPKKEGTYSILLKIHNNIKDCSFMFYDCDRLINIDLTKFDTSNVTNMSYMFSGCGAIVNSTFDISNLNTKNVTDMSYMFAYCKELTSLSDISNWDTKNVKYMNQMFSECKSLKALPDIYKWDTKNVIDMSNMFSDCYSLDSLPNISIWNTKNVTKMNYMFYFCEKLNSLPDISKWDTKNVTDMSNMFAYCNSLRSFPDISKWDIKKVTNMWNMFCGDSEKYAPKKFKK